MLKKKREKIYNSKTKKLIKDLRFDDFAYIADSEFPMFSYVDKIEDKRVYAKFFIPQTSEMLKLAMEKLKNGYYKRVVVDDFKNRLKVYTGYLNIDDETYEYCLKYFIEKQQILEEKSNKKRAK